MSIQISLRKFLLQDETINTFLNNKSFVTKIVNYESLEPPYAVIQDLPSLFSTTLEGNTKFVGSYQINLWHNNRDEIDTILNAMESRLSGFRGMMYNEVIGYCLVKNKIVINDPDTRNFTGILEVKIGK